MGGQEDAGTLHVVAGTPAVGGDAVCDLLVAGIGRIQQGRIHLRGHIAGGDGIDIDAPGDPIVAQLLGQLGDTMVRKIIRGSAAASR